MKQRTKRTLGKTARMLISAAAFVPVIGEAIGNARDFYDDLKDLAPDEAEYNRILEGIRNIKAPEGLNEDDASRMEAAIISLLENENMEIENGYMTESGIKNLKNELQKAVFEDRPVDSSVIDYISTVVEFIGLPFVRKYLMDPEDLGVALQGKVLELDGRVEKLKNEEHHKILQKLDNVATKDDLLRFLYTDDNAESQSLSEFESFIRKMKPDAEISVNIFNFRNPRIRFQGRKSELRELNVWLNQEGLSVWAITGWGGCGKSKLALHLVQQFDSECYAVWMDEKRLRKIEAFDDFNCSKPVLLIFDNSEQYRERLPELINTMSRTKINAKILLLDRTGYWYEFLLERYDVVKEHAYSNQPIRLEKSELSEGDYASIIQDLSDALYSGKEITNDARIQIIQKAKELSGSSDTIRCLFLLLVADAYLKNNDIWFLDAPTLLHNYFQHSRSIIQKLYGEDLTRKGYRILAYATAFGGCELDVKHPLIQDDLQWVIDKIDDREQLNIFFNRLSESKGDNYISALKPDLIGEYLFLYELNHLPEKKRQKEWVDLLGKYEYSWTFLVMCMDDWMWMDESHFLREMCLSKSGKLRRPGR